MKKLKQFRVYYTEQVLGYADVEAEDKTEAEDRFMSGEVINDEWHEDSVVGNTLEIDRIERASDIPF